MGQSAVHDGRATSAAPEIPLARLDDADPALMGELLVAVRRVPSTASFVLGEEVARGSARTTRVAHVTRTPSKRALTK
jgi:hypothetical protein